MHEFSVKKLKEIFVEPGFVDEANFVIAMQQAEDAGEPIEKILVDLDLLKEDQVGRLLAEHLGYLYANPVQEQIEDDIFFTIPVDLAKAKKVVALRRQKQGIKVGMVKPDDLDTIYFLEKEFGSPIYPSYITHQGLAIILDRYKEDLGGIFKGYVEEFCDEDISQAKRNKLVTQLVDTLLEYSYQKGASDVHIEPQRKTVLVRFRVDGVLHDMLEIERSMYEYILARVKILSRMRTDEHRAAQDGKFRFSTEGKGIDVRVSVVPTSLGENIVMRVLSSKHREYSLSELGLSSNDFDTVKQVIKNPHGMILVTGPTGSGKTTTLYAILKLLNKREINIATIEDPIEYSIEGITQIQVNPRTNLTFAQGLRALVRQDPDIIMVGEIRDEETAEIAVNSALTGHLVLSTLHTNDAPTTLPRLLDMNIEPFLVSSTVQAIVAQRLVRKICMSCRVSTQLDAKYKKYLTTDPTTKKILKEMGYKNISKVRVYKGVGCKVCGKTGYAGRFGIFEVMGLSDEIKELIMENADAEQIKRKAIDQGMTTMIEDGLHKVFSGVTSIEEVLRVTRG